MAVLVTGASGFVGGAVVRALRAQGRAVLATGRDPVTCAALGDCLALDLAAPDAAKALEHVARQRGISAVVHAAALTAPWGRRAEFQRSNVDATRTVLTLAKHLGVRRIVHISTPSVYFRFADQIGLTEDTPLPTPVNDYTATKAQAEGSALAAGAVILRPRGIYGAGDRALLPRLVRAIQSGPLPLLRNGQAATDLTHVDDVVAAILAALGGAGVAGQVLNISGGVALPIRDVVAAVSQHLGLIPRWRPLPLPAVMLAARGMELEAHVTGSEPRVTRYGVGLFAFTQTLDIQRAARILGWHPTVSFDEGLRRTFATRQD